MSISFAATPQSKEAQQARTYTDPSAGAPPSRRSGYNAPYVDLGHWNKVFTDQNYFDSIAKQKGMTEGAKVSLHGDDYVYRQAMIGFLADTRKVPLDDMRSIFDAEKDGFAKKVLGKQTASAREMFDYQKGQFERSNEKKAAADQILQGVIRRSLEDALSGGDTPFVESVGKDIDAASEMFDDEEKSRLWEKAEELDMKIRASQDKFAPEARFIFDALQQSTGQKTGFGAPDMRDMASRFAQLPDNQRKAIYELAGGFAQITQTDKGFWYQMAESLGRGASDIVERVPRNFREQTLRGQLRLLNSDQPVFRATGVAGAEFSAAGSTPVFGATQGQMLTPEEREEAKAKIQSDLGVLKVERELRDLAERVVDPIKMTGVLPEIIEEGLYGAARSIPYTAVAAVPIAGVPAVASALFSSNYDRIMLEYPDLDPDKAALIAAISAPIEAGLERMKVNTITGRLPVFGGLVKRLQHPNQRNITRIAIGGAGIVAEQNVQEIVQNATFPFVQTIAAALDADMPDYDWEERLAGMPRELAVQFVALLPLSLMGVGALSYREISRGENYLKSKADLEKMGYSTEQIDRITGAESAEAAQAALVEEHGKRDPKLVKAAAQRIVDESIALREKANPAALPRLEKQGADYVVLSPEGKELARTTDQTAAEQALVSARRETVQREMRDVHTGINEAVAFIQRVNEARQRGEDVAKVIREEAPRTLLTDYEANPTQENLDRLFETVRAFGQDINEPAELANFPVTGSNQGALREGIWRSIIRINEGADGTIVMREFAQDNLKRAMAEGRVTIDFVRQQLNDILPQIDSERMDRQLRTETDTDVIEAFSDVALAYFRGQIREEQIPAGLRGIMRRLAIFTRDIFRRAYNLARLRAEGKLDRDFEALLAEAVGVDQQALVDRSREKTAQEVAPEMANYSIGLREPDAFRFNEQTLPNGNVRFIAYHGSEQALSEIQDQPIYVSSMSDGAGYGEPTRVIVEGKFVSENEIEAFAAKYGIAMEDLFHDEASMEQDLQEALRAEGYDGAMYYDQRRDDGEVVPAAIVVNPQAIRVEPVANYSIAVPSEVDEAAVYDSVLKLAGSRKWDRGRDLKMAMQEAVLSRAQAAGVDVSDMSPETKAYLVRVALRDALFALKQNPNAIGWYDIKTRQALAVMALIHPEIGTDENARFAFTWILAVTSNGLKVDMNFDLAESVYRQYKKKKVMPTNVGIGTAGKAINNSLKLFNRLAKEWGIDNFRAFTQTTFKVAEISSIDKNLKPSGEFAATDVRGAAIAGPKIGNGFFSNLNGFFDALTMDRWLIRTWGRWTGTLIKAMPEQTTKATERLQKAVEALSSEQASELSAVIGLDIPTATMPELAQALAKASMDKEIREALNSVSEELRKAGNSLAKYLDGQKEAPSGPAERNNVREIFQSVLDELRATEEYKDLTMADLQAVLWYAEKRLYESAKEDFVDDDETEGYADDEAPDYANAAAKVARDKGVSQARISKALTDTANVTAGGTRSSNAGRLGAAGGQQGAAGGFTQGQKRLFRGNVAVRTVRRGRGSNAAPSWSYSREGSGDGGSVRVLKKIAVKYTASYKAGRDIRRVFRNNGIEAPRFVELVQDEANATRFSELITASKKASKFGAAVYVYPTGDYQGMRLFLSEDGTTGFALKSNGDIVSVFSTGGAGHGALELAVAEGGTRLDAFDTILPDYYSSHGFVAVSRLKWDDSQSPDGWNKTLYKEFNNGEPDVVFMAHQPSYLGWYSQNDGTVYTDYNDAVDAQDRAVADATTGANISTRNYSISTQSEIDRVGAALNRLDRDPLERVKIYEKAQEKFLRVMADNRDMLAGMQDGDLAQMRRTQILQALGELDGIISVLPPEVRSKIGGYTQLAKVDPMDVFKGDQKVSEVRGMSGAIISAWMREGLNIGEAQKKTELPAGYRAERNLDPTRADRAIADVFIQRINRINEALEKFLRDEYNDAAVELFKRAKPQRSGAGEKPKGKLGADVHDLFDKLKEATEWSAEEAQAYADGQWARIENGELNPYEETHAMMAAQMVPLFADWANADSSQRAAAVTMGKDVLNRAYKGEQQRIIAQRTKRGYDRTDLSKDAGVSAEDDKARQDALKRENSLPSKWESAMLNLLNFDQVLRYVFGNDSKIARQISDRQRKADNAKSDDIAALSDEWAAFLSELGGGEMQGQQLLFELSRMDEEIDGVSYSQNQLIAISMMWMQPKGRQHMEGFLDSDGQPAGKWHYNQDFVNKAEKLLRPESKAIRQYLLAKYDAEYEAINKVYRKVYGLNLPKNQFYSPLVVESIRAPAQAGIDPVTGGVFAAGANSPSALRSRGGAIAQPVFRDAVQTYFGHMLQMAHWKAYAEFNGEVSALLGHRDTRNVVKGKAGEQAATVMNNWLQYFQQGGNKDAANHLAINQMINRMTGNFATMALFGRISTLALQVTQLGAASAKMPVGAYLSRFGKLMSGRLGWKTALDSAYIQRRIKDMPPAVALAMQGLRSEKPNAIREAARRIGSLISGFDGFFTAGTYAIVYDYQLSQASRNGMGGQEAADYAREATERIVDEIAQPTRAGARSIFEINSTNPVARAVWAFSSESRKNLGLGLYAGAKGSGKDLGKAVFYVLVLNGLVGTIIRNAFRDLRDDDDEETFDEKNWGWNRMAAMLISDPLYGFPVVGEAVESAIFNAFGVYTPSGPLFDVAPAVPAVKRLAYDYPMGEQEAEFRDIVRDVNRILSTAGLFNNTIAGAAAISNLVKDTVEVGDNVLNRDE
jgi:hypothetical protein